VVQIGGLFAVSSLYVPEFDLPVAAGKTFVDIIKKGDQIYLLSVPRQIVEVLTSKYIK